MKKLVFLSLVLVVLLLTACHKNKPFTQTKLYGQTPVVIEQNYSSDANSIVYTSRIEVISKEE